MIGIASSLESIAQGHDVVIMDTSALNLNHYDQQEWKFVEGIFGGRVKRSRVASIELNQELLKQIKRYENICTIAPVLAEVRQGMSRLYKRVNQPTGATNQHTRTKKERTRKIISITQAMMDTLALREYTEENTGALTIIRQLIPQQMEGVDAQIVAHGLLRGLRSSTAIVSADRNLLEMGVKTQGVLAHEYQKPDTSFFRYDGQRFEKYNNT